MKRTKVLIALLLASILIISQAAVVFAAPALDSPDLISGTVQGITLETDPNTGVITILVDVLAENNESQTIRIGQEKAVELGLVVLDDDGNLLINEDALGQEVEIKAKDAIPDDEENQHPVGDALATFFSDISGLDYDAIMSAHDDGHGFGVIAQALWLTQKLGGDAEDFALILQAKQDRDYSGFVFEDGTSPTNWGQFRKALLGEDKKGSLGIVMSDKDKDNDGSGNNDNGNNDGNGNSNNGNGNNGNSDNANNKDKDKEKSNNGKDNGKGKKP